MLNKVPEKDLRIRRTRKLLWKSLLELLDSKLWDNISIGDICQTAMVHRTTFYKHFENKEDLLERGFSDMVQETLDSMAILPPPHYNSSEPPPVDLVKLFLQQVLDYKGLYTFVFSGKSSNAYTYTIRRILADRMQLRIQQFVAHFQVPLPPGLPPLELLANYQAGALLSIVAWWFETGMAMPMDKLATEINRLMDIRKLLD